jgi:formate dehydrogenase subunit beta
MKFMKDINTYYGTFQAGADATTPAPQVTFKPEDVEPSVVERKA